uniref:Uncharacterized protein n=1 Tax=Cacopsylla melanoneura TaxID=428564 RepID=A0A8D8Z5S4_9HEMI
MARSKKLSTEELKARKRARERARYAKIKADQVLNELQKEKERKKYENKKIKKQVKLVADMTPRERRVHRKLWREKFKKHYQRKCTNTSYIQLTPPSSPENNADQRPQSVQVNSGKKRIHRDRSKIIKRNKKLQEENEKLRRQRDMYRKRHERSKLQKAPRHDKTDDTPKTKIRKLMKKKNHKQLIQRQLIFGEAMKQQLKLNFKQMRKEKKFSYASSILGNKHVFKKYNMVKEVLSILPSSSARYNNFIAKRKLKKLHNEVKGAVCKFLEDDENSRMTPGKKDTITVKKCKKQKRYLNDTMLNLHKKFIKSQTLYKISYPVFCRLRPFWVVYQKPEMRDTCECKLCVNTNFVVSALYRAEVINEKNAKELSAYLCCEFSGISCLQRNCDKCQKEINYNEFNGSMDISYASWVLQADVYKDKHGNKKKSMHTVKLQNKVSAYKLVNILEDIFPKYMNHQSIIRNQYIAMKYLKLTLDPQAVLLHIDFSENYSLKYSTEIQSFHFGGSRDQVTLHTSSLMYKQNTYSELTTKSFCTLSKNLKHGPPQILAHLEPVFNFINKEIPNLKEIHFWSDGPSSQYKNKYMFYTFGNLIQDYFPSLSFSTWNYFESGHGKGLPDGIGGTVKRTADRLVAQGNDLSSFEVLVQHLNKSLRQISICVIDESAIDAVEKKVNRERAIGFKGTLKVRQISHIHSTHGPVTLIMKSLSCFQCVQKEDRQDKCTHHRLGQLKYKTHCNESSVALPEEIVCEPRYSRRIMMMARL